MLVAKLNSKTFDDLPTHKVIPIIFLRLNSNIINLFNRAMVLCLAKTIQFVYYSRSQYSIVDIISDMQSTKRDEYRRF